jgi:hypothetical protein
VHPYEPSPARSISSPPHAEAGAPELPLAEIAQTNSACPATVIRVFREARRDPMTGSNKLDR